MCRLILRCVAVSLLVVLAAPEGRAEPPAAEAPTFSYPLTLGQLTFPQDEGKHAFGDWPMTLIEWFAHYTHLTAEDGTRYLLFATFVTFDPLESVLGGKFPHLIATLIDVTNQRTWHHRDMGPLAHFATGYADTATTMGDFFRWRGADQPFQYDLRVGWRDDAVAVMLETSLRALKPPLALNGTGYIKLPKGDSGYYSQTRLAAQGTLTVDGKTQRVSGIHWVDRQWLGLSCAQNLGYTYEWWALQLDNHQEAILFRIFEEATNTVAMTVLEVLDADGTRRKSEMFTLTDLESGWAVVAPDLGWDIRIVPAFAGQQTWQSADITGTVAGQPVGGVVAVELARDVMREYMSVIRPAAGAPPGG